MSSSTASVTVLPATPHLRAVPPLPDRPLSLPEGATVVATLPQSALPHGLLARYGEQLGAPGHPLVGYLVLAAAEQGQGQGQNQESERSAPRGISVDRDQRSALVDGLLLDLTYLEFELLAHLTANPRRVYTREALVTAVWGYDHVGDGRTVDVHVARLRHKLGSTYRNSIVTIRRVGYKYVPMG